MRQPRQTRQEARRQTHREWLSAALPCCSRGLSVIVNSGLQRPARFRAASQSLFLWGEVKKRTKETCLRKGCVIKTVDTSVLSFQIFIYFWIPVIPLGHCGEPTGTFLSFQDWKPRLLLFQRIRKENFAHKTVTKYCEIRFVLKPWGILRSWLIMSSANMWAVICKRVGPLKD